MMRTEAEIAHDEHQFNNAPVKLIPAPAGTRQQRRAAAARKLKSLPKSIWLITHVGVGQHVETATPMYRVAIEKRHQRDVMFVFSREGAAPVQGGLLERTALPNGGEAAIWTDARAAKESMGGGYTRAAVPKEWGFSAAPVVAAEPRAFQNLNLGEPWPGADFRPATREEFIANVASVGEFRELPMFEPVVEIDRNAAGNKLIKGDRK